MTQNRRPDDLANHWQRDGYIVVSGLIHSTRAARLGAIAESILDQWRECNPETGEPGGGPDATVMRHLNHPRYFRQDSARGLVDLLQAVADPAVLDVCRAILDAEPLFRCTSLFMNPESNSQNGNWHRDSQFHHPDEEEERQAIDAGGGLGRSVQLQVALVPSDDVEVVPGSHRRWDTDAEYAIRRADEQRNNRSNAMPGALRVALAPGDAVAFNPLALHRGRYHTDKRRRTLMLTYTSSMHPRFDYFSDQPWFDTAGYLADLDQHTCAFFEQFVNRYGDEWRAKIATQTHEAR
jgi:hypothetical protein